MWLMALTGTPAFFASNEAARFWSRRVIANHLSAGIRGECERAIRQFVLHGLATVSTLTSGPAALLIALPCPGEDRAIGPYQVGPRLAVFTWQAADQYHPVSSLESLFRLVVGDRAGQ